MARESDQSWVWAFVVLTLLSIVLEFVAVELPHGGIVSLATITHLATILLVPAPFAAISVGSAVLVEELIHRARSSGWRSTPPATS